MRVAYIFTSETSQKILNYMIIPQLKKGIHGAEVAGMFFFMDNSYFLLKDTEMGEELNKLSKEQNIMLMACDICAAERGITDKLVDQAKVGCFPNLYEALGGANIDQVITL